MTARCILRQFSVGLSRQTSGAFYHSGRYQPDVSPALAGGLQKQWNAHTAPLGDMIDDYCTGLWSGRVGLRTDKNVVGGKDEKRGAPINLYHITRDVYTCATTWDGLKPRRTVERLGEYPRTLRRSPMDMRAHLTEERI